jgi:hypothetical protein
VDKNKVYFLYRHIRLDKNVPFYVGIGTKRTDAACHEVEYERAFYTRNRNKTWKGIVSRTEYRVEIVFECNDRNLINEKEKEFIKLYGRITDKTGSLVNYTNGGDNEFTFSEELKARLSKVHKDKYLAGYEGPMTGKKYPEGAKIAKSKPVIQYDLKGNRLNEFYGITEAANKTNSDSRLIHKVLNGLRKKHNGFIWQYKNDRGQR